jgi:hypothetical protein
MGGMKIAYVNLFTADLLRTAEFFERLRELEESLWRGETRFDTEAMRKIFAPDLARGLLESEN